MTAGHERLAETYQAYHDDIKNLQEYLKNDCFRLIRIDWGVDPSARREFERKWDKIWRCEKQVRFCAEQAEYHREMVK